jgi:hypothetical protein
MIRYYRHNEIDKSAWDNCIENSQNGLIYACSWYLDIVCPGWGALVQDNYDSVMPLPEKSKFGLSYIYKPVFTQQMGVFYRIKIDEPKFKLFLNSIPQHIRFADICVNADNNFVISEYSSKENNNYELNLEKGYQELFNFFSENHKRNIKKASTFDLTFKEDLNIEGLIDFKKKNNEIFVNEKELNILNIIAGKSFKKGIGKIYSTFNAENQRIASVFFVFYKNRATYLFPVSNREGIKKRAMFYLIDNIIKKYSGSKIILDFEGSNIPGIAFFFSGFGAVSQNYLSFRINRLPWYIKFLKHS